MPLGGNESLSDRIELRKTKQRRQLFDLLKSKSEPMTADQILKICQLESPNMALTTVYRNLDKMVDLGYATRIASIQGAARYCVQESQKRIQLFCRICNRVTGVEDVDIKLLESLIHEKTGFNIEQGNLEFYGVCADCKRQMP